MRRRVWVVLGLVGMAPVGALAQQAAGQAGTVQAEGPNAEVFQGTLRAVDGDRLRMADGHGRIYEFGLGAQSRLVGPEGQAASWQALREGMPVRTVTRPGASENEVVTLQVFVLPEEPPSR